MLGINDVNCYVILIEHILAFQRMNDTVRVDVENNIFYAWNFS